MIRFLRKITYFIVIFSINSWANISDEFLDQILQEFQKTLAEAKEKLQIQGCVAVIAKKDRIIRTICLGTTNMNKPEQIKPYTMFPLSSLTKNITAFVTAALVDEGIISFDDKVRKYLPGFFIGNDDISEKFTIRDLISHRSGFHHFLGNSLWHCGYSYAQMINSLKFINNVSGFRKKYGYQNVIFGIIGDVMEAATGKTYDELVNKYIFSKIHLQNSSTRPLYIEASWFEQLKYNLKTYGFWYALKNICNIKTHHVVNNHILYKGNRTVCKMNDYYQRIPATAAISMSGDDFGQWLRVLLNEGTFGKDIIVSKKNYNELIKNHINITGLKRDNQTFPTERLRNSYYGMGIFGADYGNSDGTNSRKILFHMGGVYGACTFFAYSPADGIAIGVLANTGGNDKTLFSELMCWDFLDRVFGLEKKDWIQTELDFKSKIEAEKKRNTEELEETNPGPHAKLIKYTGTYTSKIYGNINIAVENNTLVINNGIKKAALKHLNRNIFLLNGLEFCDDTFDRDEFVIFYENNNGEFDRTLISCMDENQTVFTKIK